MVRVNTNVLVKTDQIMGTNVMLVSRFRDYKGEPSLNIMIRQHPTPSKQEVPLTSISVTRFIQEHNAGDKEALNKLVRLVYNELLIVARAYRSRMGAGVTLDTKAIVHEAYEHIFNSSKLDFESRKHFYATVSQAMRWIICDYARRAKAEKRGGMVEKLSITSAGKLFGDEMQSSQMSQIDLILSVDKALSELEKIDPEMTQLVNLRFFFGLSIEEASKALEVSTRTLNREWRIAKLYLAKCLKDYKDLDIT